MGETNEVLEITKETAKKVDLVVEAYKRKDRECDRLHSVVMWLITAIMTFIVVVGIVAGIFVYGYMYSPYLYGQVNNTSDGANNGNQVNMIGG